MDGRTDGRWLDGYTISSPCEPNGSGELTREEVGGGGRLNLIISSPEPKANR